LLVGVDGSSGVESGAVLPGAVGAADAVHVDESAPTPPTHDSVGAPAPSANPTTNASALACTPSTPLPLFGRGEQQEGGQHTLPPAPAPPAPPAPPTVQHVDWGGSTGELARALKLIAATMTSAPTPITSISFDLVPGRARFQAGFLQSRMPLVHMPAT
jgi:hypothetical protein